MQDESLAFLPGIERYTDTNTNNERDTQLHMFDFEPFCSLVYLRIIARSHIAYCVCVFYDT